MVEITFTNETPVEMKEWEVLGTELINSVIETLNIGIDITIGVTFAEKEKALELNKRYRHESYIPDVISFPSGITFNEAQQIGNYELGDLVICYEVAKLKSSNYHHDLKTEMAFLFVHGCLHLLGYDHEQEADQEKMFALQDEVLKKNGFDYTVIFDDLDYL